MRIKHGNTSERLGLIPDTHRPLRKVTEVPEPALKGLWYSQNSSRRVLAAFLTPGPSNSADAGNVARRVDQRKDLTSSPPPCPGRDCVGSGRQEHCREEG